MYYIHKFLMGLLSILPWRVISLLSHCFRFVMYNVIRYRREVVESHIGFSFPEKTPKEQQAIIKQFYYNLVYIFFSSPKLLSLPKETLKAQHLKIEGVELFTQLQAQGKKHFIVLMGHCGNWELFSAGQIYFDALGLRQEQLYRPLKNKAFDKVQKEQRERYGSITTPKSSIGRRMLKLVRDKDSEATIFAFIADQTPKKGQVGLWTNFLNRETAFLDGAERLAKKFDLPVLYLDITREKDAVYRGEIKLISAKPKETEDGGITQAYVKLLEETIQRTPSDWLWSHKRWKFTKEEDSKSI